MYFCIYFGIYYSFKTKPHATELQVSPLLIWDYSLGLQQQKFVINVPNRLTAKLLSLLLVLCFASCPAFYLEYKINLFEFRRRFDRYRNANTRAALRSHKVGCARSTAAWRGLACAVHA